MPITLSFCPRLSPQGPSPNSLHHFLIFFSSFQDLGDMGWRLQTSADVCASICANVRPEMPERHSDAHALFLLR